jgi:tRNA nucleotidyltransferase/poly(A) polymerase
MSSALEVVRAALADGRAWLVGGAVRDRALGREPDGVDLDVVVDGDPGEAAAAIARAAGGAAAFPLSSQFGAWRVVARDPAWQVDVEALRGGSIEADLALRDFTVNAIAEPLGGGGVADPLDGRGDLAARRLRMVSAQAFADDPLRVLRLVRVALELQLQAEPGTLGAAAANAAGLASVSSERIFAELRRILAVPDAVRGVETLRELGALAVVLPEVDSLRGVEQSHFHHRDVYGHTLEVLERSVELTLPAGPPPAELGDALEGRWDEVAAVLREPLADGLTRGQALRWGALLHDAAKPLTRGELPDGRITFMGHDAAGSDLARALLTRLRASERLRAHVAALVRHHLRLGFLVHETQPLPPRSAYAYLHATTPVEVDVTILSLADRLATRGERSSESIARHVAVAGPLLARALRFRRDGPPPPLLRGDELARELGIAPGPWLGELLEELAAARYAGEIGTREQALQHIREIARGRRFAADA